MLALKIHLFRTPLTRLRKMQDCIRDYRLLLQWYSTPQVQSYFTPSVATLEETVKKYRPRILGEHPCLPYIIETDMPVGYLRRYFRLQTKKLYDIVPNHIKFRTEQICL